MGGALAIDHWVSMTQIVASFWMLSDFRDFSGPSSFCPLCTSIWFALGRLNLCSIVSQSSDSVLSVLMEWGSSCGLSWLTSLRVMEMVGGCVEGLVYAGGGGNASDRFAVGFASAVESEPMLPGCWLMMLSVVVSKISGWGSGGGEGDGVASSPSVAMIVCFGGVGSWST